MTGATRDPGTLGGITPEALAAAYPRWRTPARAGNTWITMRPGTQEHWGPGSLMRMSLSALTLGGLAEQLDLQSYLDRLDPGELAAIWRQGQVPAPGMPAARS
jgi:hypothetical protein